MSRARPRRGARHPYLITALVTAAGACGPPPPRATTPAQHDTVIAPSVTPIEVEVTRAIGDFDRAILERLVRGHAITCQRDGARGTTTLELALSDNPPRHGMRVISSSDRGALGTCLGRVLPAATWPTGHLDGFALFTVAVRVHR